MLLAKKHLRGCKVLLSRACLVDSPPPPNYFWITFQLEWRFLIFFTVLSLLPVTKLPFKLHHMWGREGLLFYLFFKTTDSRHVMRNKKKHNWHSLYSGSRRRISRMEFRRKGEGKKKDSYYITKAKLHLFQDQIQCDGRGGKKKGKEISICNFPSSSSVQSGSSSGSIPMDGSLCWLAG